MHAVVKRVDCTLSGHILQKKIDLFSMVILPLLSHQRRAVVSHWQICTLRTDQPLRRISLPRNSVFRLPHSSNMTIIAVYYGCKAATIHILFSITTLRDALTANELNSDPSTCRSLLTVFNFLTSATLATGKLSAAVVGVALKSRYKG